MGVFFIDTSGGQVATRRQLLEAGIGDPTTEPPRPWLRIQGTSDASTLWYAVLRRRERGVWIGALTMRHSTRHEQMLGAGWEDVPLEEIGAGLGLSEQPRIAKSPFS